MRSDRLGVDPKIETAVHSGSKESSYTNLAIVEDKAVLAYRQRPCDGYLVNRESVWRLRLIRKPLCRCRHDPVAGYARRITVKTATATDQNLPRVVRTHCEARERVVAFGLGVARHR